MIYTREGDNGMTKVAGQLLSKDNQFIHDMGVIDELVCQIGLARAEELSCEIDGILQQIQNELYWASSIEFKDPMDKAVERMEKDIDKHAVSCAFSFPGHNRVNALLHVARAVCRRAERQMVGTHLTKYLNRLSDLLFVLAEY